MLLGGVLPLHFLDRVRGWGVYPARSALTISYVLSGFLRYSGKNTRQNDYLFSLYPGLKTGAIRMILLRGFLSWPFLPRAIAPGYYDVTSLRFMGYPDSTDSVALV